MKKWWDNLNEFEKLFYKRIFIIIGILLHSIIYGLCVTELGLANSKYVDLDNQPFWFIALTANFFGIGIDVSIITSIGIIYSIIIRPINSTIELYKRTYPKQSKISISNKYKQVLKNL